MAEQVDVTISVHGADLDFVVEGRWEAADPSVGERAGLADMVLLWPDEAPVEDAMLEIIGAAAVEHAFDTASEKAAEDGPPGPDPDYLRDMREEAA